MTPNDLSNPNAFHEYMISVNSRLQQEGLAIAARPVRAWRILQQQLALPLTWLGGPEAERVVHWFVTQYGVRASVIGWHRRLLAILGGDPWVLNVPMVYGKQRIDLGRMIENGVPALMARITKAELRALDEVVVPAMDALNALNHTEPELYSDWLGAVEHATGGFPNYGMSRWSSQQAFEKIAKEFIKRNGGQPDHSHNLPAIVAAAEGRGLTPVDRALLAKVECRPGARYPGSPESRASTAVLAAEAHQASVILSGRIAAEWQATPHWEVQQVAPLSPTT
jgi:hypothetical protein